MAARRRHPAQYSGRHSLGVSDQRPLKAVFARGGTSKGLIFHRADLPADRAAWDALFLAALGSPDPYGRQLDGLGGGVSSVSKVCVVGPSTRADADVDYLFAQVFVREARVAYDGNCGNMSAAIGPFALDEGLVKADGDQAVVRIHNVNTGRIIESAFGVQNGHARVTGDLAIPGVAGTGAPVKLTFRKPDGAWTEKMLPTGNARDDLIIGGRVLSVSLVDAASPLCFVGAADVGLRGDETPQEIESRADIMTFVEDIRRTAGMRMRPDLSEADIAANAGPLVMILSSSQDAIGLTGEMIGRDNADLTIRVIASRQAHRASPMTGAVCAGIARAIDGTIVALMAGGVASDIRLATPSGVIHVVCDVHRRDGLWHAEHATVLRTQRRLFQGEVLIPF